MKTVENVSWVENNSWWLLLYIVATVVGWGMLWTWSMPKDFAMKPWYPAKFTIANIVEEKYVSINEVSLSGNMVFISSIEEYKVSFKNAEHTVIQINDGSRYCLCKVNEITYVLKESVPPHNPLRGREITGLDQYSGVTAIHCPRNGFNVVLFGFIWFAVCLWYFGIRTHIW